MDEALNTAALLLVAATATLAVLCRDPERQAVALSVFGLALTVLFLVLQAPDVALAQLVVGTALTPLLILLTARKVRRGPAAGGSGGPGERADRGGPEPGTSGRRTRERR
ncbi:DUF4040 domain-containing protein [Streptomyces sp. NPDC007369]|uniref:Na(+)/H(+) antiporter subunit B n=1 Tax=Streptomyces sp. NPDC007369 TaxID=3154589 RepID=UPI0033F4D02F